MRWDVAIVGGSFAGLACAEEAAARGLRTIVLDRRRGPGDAPHTTGLLVREVADAWDVPRSIVRRVPGVRLYAPSLRSIDLESPGYHFLATDTPALMRWMARRAADAGAELAWGVEYPSGLPPARFLVGADGPRSRVARDHGLGVNRDFLAGVEWEMEGVRGVDPDRLHCFIDSRLAPGYIAWVVPGVRVTQVGLAGRRPAPVAGFVRRLSGLFDFSGARVVGRRGGLIPVGGPVSPAVRGRVLLVGDAAGLVSPLTGGGIHTALESGRAAGIAIAEGRPIVHPRFRWKRLLRAALDLGCPDGLVDALLASRAMRALAQAVFFHHRGLFSAAAWRDMALAVIR